MGCASRSSVCVRFGEHGGCSRIRTGCCCRSRQDPGLAQLPLVLAVGQNPSSGGPQDFEAAACLEWPVSQSTLLEAIFRFVRPSAIGEDGRQPIPSTRRAGSGEESFRILVAEDLPANQELIIALFENSHDSLTIVNNGREAVQALQSESFDVVLMDIQMPEMGGVEATEMIRRIDTLRGRHTPIIALTAHAMKGDRERHLAAGMDGYVSKPILASELYREVDKWRGSHALSV